MQLYWQQNSFPSCPLAPRPKEYLKGLCRGLLFDPCFKLRICTVLHSLMINISAFIGKARHFALRPQMPSWRLCELAGSRMQLRGCQDMEGKQRTLLCYGFSFLFFFINIISSRNTMELNIQCENNSKSVYLTFLHLKIEKM